MTDIAAIEFNSWRRLFDFGRSLGQTWFYRGQSDADWELTSSLERAIGVDHGDDWLWQHTERWMLRKFQGFAHNYLAHPPANDDRVEWLALMQHHGAPTRLLDCTFSFPVAAYFAAWEAKSDFAIWAFNWNRFRLSLIDRFNLKLNDAFAALEFHAEMHGKANDFLSTPPILSGAMAFPVVPPRANERLEAQQGLFLFPSDVARTLQENLQCLVGPRTNIKTINERSSLVPYDTATHDPAKLHKHWLLKLMLPKIHRFEVVNDLHNMNIHEASLFPGLDGFARSLRRYTVRNGPNP
jgi:hypothetical protein